MRVLEAPFCALPRQAHLPAEHNAQNREIAAYSDYRPQAPHIPVYALVSISTHNANCDAKDTGINRIIRD
ncbi:MAG: hypothetical protein QOF15_2907 [Mycobacterium sp.]|jgi:hypothetical protein|nr:hypothetical protein [Mycobacterium sp.]